MLVCVPSSLILGGLLSPLHRPWRHTPDYQMHMKGPGGEMPLWILRMTKVKIWLQHKR